jgi:hypothetical protein
MAVQTSSRNAQSAPKSHFLFLIIWVLLSAVATAILVGAYFFEARRDKDLLCENTRDILRLQKTMIAEDLSDMINDVLFVARHLESLEPWNTPKDRWVSTATTDMSLFADARQTYSQVRLIDANENEVVRIEYHHNRAAPVRPDALQHKEHRYYVQVSKQLDHGEVYISPMDLNVEQGQIETPYRPTIRFCTPIYTPDGEYFGLVVLNYRADLLRTLIGELATFSGSQTMIANARGYWLMHPNEAMKWGWHIPGRESATLKNQIPDLWDASRLVKSGAVERPEGLYLYDTMTCTNVQASTMGPAEFCRLSGKMGLDDEDGFTWLLIHHIPRSTLVAARMRLSKTLLVVLIFFCLLLLPLAWILAQFIVRRRHRNELLRTQAFLDPVTQLANRHRFLEQLEQAFQMAKRFEDPFAVAFLDLDRCLQKSERDSKATCVRSTSSPGWAGTSSPLSSPRSTKKPAPRSSRKNSSMRSASQSTSAGPPSRFLRRSESRSTTPRCYPLTICSAGRTLPCTPPNSRARTPTDSGTRTSRSTPRTTPRTPSI